MFSRCRLSRGEPAEMSSQTTTFDSVDPQERKRILDKLAKLKALSECRTGNVNETATAAAAMTRIMLEYEIEMADLHLGETGSDLDVLEESVYAAESLNGFPKWQSSLLSALAEVHHCQCYRDSRTDYVYWTRVTESFLMLIGTRKDIENTRRLYFYCVSEIERLCEDLCIGRPVKWKNDFKRGASRGIADKVRAEHERVMQQEREKAQKQGAASLALQLFDRKQQAVAQFAEDLGLVSRTARVRAPSKDAFQVGYAAGANLDLSGGSRPLLTSGQ